MTYIQNLTITNFRCYEVGKLEKLGPAPVILFGKNGAGKTNLLEAVSFLVPGRGFRGAKVSEVQNEKTIREKDPWAVSAFLETDYGLTTIGTGAFPDKEKRRVRINGEDVSSQNALSEYLSCVWLVPQMDQLFLDSSGTRRRFFDRLILAFDPAHAGRIRRYENAMGQRSKILKEYSTPDETWLAGLESSMAETGVAIAAARLDFLARLQHVCDQASAEEEKHFPKAQLLISGTVEELLRQSPALEVEEMFLYQLQQTRSSDAITGGSATGPHKSDLLVKYAKKNMPADQCSTGEQKALLISIVLAHARLVAAERGAPPLILLDEIAAHLDEARRAALYDRLLALKTQVWLTGTDRSLFKYIESRGHVFEIDNAKILWDRKLKTA